MRHEADKSAGYSLELFRQVWWLKSFLKNIKVVPHASNLAAAAKTGIFHPPRMCHGPA